MYFINTHPIRGGEGLYQYQRNSIHITCILSISYSLFDHTMTGVKHCIFDMWGMTPGYDRKTGQTSVVRLYFIMLSVDMTMIYSCFGMIYTCVGCPGIMKL